MGQLHFLPTPQQTNFLGDTWVGAYSLIRPEARTSVEYWSIQTSEVHGLTNFPVEQVQHHLVPKPLPVPIMPFVYPKNIVSAG